MQTEKKAAKDNDKSLISMLSTKTRTHDAGICQGRGEQRRGTALENDDSMGIKYSYNM
jgi:hypothetical protein